MTKQTGIVVLMALGAVAHARTEPVRHISYTTLEYKKAYYHAVIANMSGDAVMAETLYRPRLTSIWSFMGDSQPVAAITGTFFAFENQQPVADVLVDGALVANGRRGSVLAVDWFGRVSIFDAKFKQELDWFPYRYALRGLVRVVSDGKVNPNPKAQQFRDSAIWGNAARTGVGLTANGKLVMIATKNKATLSDLGNAMKKLNVVNGVALDGGGSTALYYRGSLVVPPSRRLSTLFAVHERNPLDAAYQRHIRSVAETQSDRAIKAAFTAPPVK